MQSELIGMHIQLTEMEPAVVGKDFGLIGMQSARVEMRRRSIGM